MKNFLLALQFLTILPIKIKPKVKEKDFGRSLQYFSIVGMLIGLILSITAHAFGFLPSSVVSIIILIVYTSITGGIHLDGFADTCDGLYGGHSKEKILEIMRDSRIGVMGVIGVSLLLLFKFSILAAIPKGALLRALILMPAFGRCWQAFSCFASKYAREQGKAKYFIEYATRREVLFTSIATAILSVLLFQINGLILLAVSSIPTFLFMQHIKGRINGMTGDTIGAINEMAEVSMLFFALLIYT